MILEILRGACRSFEDGKGLEMEKSGISERLI